jgi:hypothetical protein
VFTIHLSLLIHHQQANRFRFCGELIFTFFTLQIKVGVHSTGYQVSQATVFLLMGHQYSASYMSPLLKPSFEVHATYFGNLLYPYCNCRLRAPAKHHNSIITLKTGIFMSTAGRTSNLTSHVLQIPCFSDPTVWYFK